MLYTYNFWDLILEVLPRPTLNEDYVHFCNLPARR